MATRFCFEYPKGAYPTCFPIRYAIGGDEDGKYFNRYECYKCTFQSVRFYDTFPFEFMLIVECEEISSKFITLSIYRRDNQVPYVHKTLLVESKAGRTLSDDFLVYNDSLFVIDVTPCVWLSKYEDQGTKSMESVVGKQELSSTGIEVLSVDIGKLLLEGNFSDVILTTDGSNEIQAHKLILSARSTVFAEMFLHPLKGNRIIIRGISYEALSQLLQFVYTGTVDIKNCHMARSLYVAADKYGVKDLKDICSMALKNYMLEDLNSVPDTLLLADLYSDEELKEASLRFICKKYSRMKTTRRWNSFAKEHQALLNEILHIIIDKRKLRNTI